MFYSISQYNNAPQNHLIYDVSCFIFHVLSQLLLLFVTKLWEVFNPSIQNSGPSATLCRYVLCTFLRRLEDFITIPRRHLSRLTDHMYPELRYSLVVAGRHGVAIFFVVNETPPILEKGSLPI